MLTFFVIVSHTLAEPVVPSAPIAIPILGLTLPHPKKIRPFFSCAYELPILQPVSFQIHACNGGGVPPASQRLDPLLPDSSSLIPFVFRSLRTPLRFFAPSKYSTPLFSIVSTLCVKNTTTGGVEVGALC